MNDKLKPCPFCGGRPIIVYNAKRKNVYESEIKGTAIGCENCNATIFYRSRRLAIEAWNRRAE